MKKTEAKTSMSQKTQAKPTFLERANATKEEKDLQANLLLAKAAKNRLRMSINANETALNGERLTLSQLENDKVNYNPDLIVIAESNIEGYQKTVTRLKNRIVTEFNDVDDNY